MQTHPNSILVQYLLCQRDHAFHLTRQQERFEFATAVKPTFCFFCLFGIEFYPHLGSWGREKKRLKRSTPFASRFMFLYGHRRGKRPPKHFFVFVGGILGTSGHHCEPLDVLLPSFGTFLTVCPPRVLGLAAILAKIVFLTRHRLNSHPVCGGGGVL